MPTSPSESRALAAVVVGDELTVTLVDGRRITVPLAWFPRLQRATPAQRQNLELLGQGQGIHWPDLDEDLSIDGILLGVKAPGGTQRAR